MHGRLAWTNHRNGNRLASGVHARVAHTVDHDRVHTIAFSLDDPGDRVRDSQRFVELALDRRGATLDLHLADLGLPPRDGLKLLGLPQETIAEHWRHHSNSLAHRSSSFLLP